MKVKDDPLKEMKEGVFDIEVIRNHAKKAIHLKTNGAKYFENYTLEKS